MHLLGLLISCRSYYRSRVFRKIWNGIDASRLNRWVKNQGGGGEGWLDDGWTVRFITDRKIYTSGWNSPVRKVRVASVDINLAARRGLPSALGIPPAKTGAPTRSFAEGRERPYVKPRRVRRGPWGPRGVSAHHKSPLKKVHAVRPLSRTLNNSKRPAEKRGIGLTALSLRLPNRTTDRNRPKKNAPPAEKTSLSLAVFACAPCFSSFAESDTNHRALSVVLMLQLPK
ncbi:hypothetical protein K0M31_016479 [Melipona bicolor]|uniref:Uncharacterized protein n=1 Tax=Melipona bicolor TaxID=60889 RepID=A0AA40KTS0_9HYME|nr:hypothetical protein K0M31_016479 [Melipona bicolor]